MPDSQAVSNTSAVLPAPITEETQLWCFNPWYCRKPQLTLSAFFTLGYLGKRNFISYSHLSLFRLKHSNLILETVSTIQLVSTVFTPQWLVCWHPEERKRSEGKDGTAKIHRARGLAADGKHLRVTTADLLVNTSCGFMSITTRLGHHGITWQYKFGGESDAALNLGLTPLHRVFSQMEEIGQYLIQQKIRVRQMDNAW